MESSALRDSCLPVIEKAINEIQGQVGNSPFGVNLIHNPSEPQWEMDLTALLIRKGITIVEASAFMGLTEALVYYRCKGLARDEAGQVRVPNRIIAKVSRLEVAEKFMSPPDGRMLASLQAKSLLTVEEINPQREIPLCLSCNWPRQTRCGRIPFVDNVLLFPAIESLARRMEDRFDYHQGNPPEPNQEALPLRLLWPPLLQWGPHIS